jgi:hypothetical protein
MFSSSLPVLHLYLDFLVLLYCGSYLGERSEIVYGHIGLCIWPGPVKGQPDPRSSHLCRV